MNNRPPVPTRIIHRRDAEFAEKTSKEMMPSGLATKRHKKAQKKNGKDSVSSNNRGKFSPFFFVPFCAFLWLIIPGLRSFRNRWHRRSCHLPTRLHDVNRADLNDYVIPPQPQTQPATSPVIPPPPPVVVLSIEECRAAALTNNLDLGVELFNPTIAHTQVTQEQAAFESGVQRVGVLRTKPSSSAGSVPSFTQTNITPDVNLAIPLQTGGMLSSTRPSNIPRGRTSPRP